MYAYECKYVVTVEWNNLVGIKFTSTKCILIYDNL